MTKRTEFHTVDFFRKIRDKQAAILAGKPGAEIIAFFNQAKENPVPKYENSTRRIATRRRK